MIGLIFQKELILTKEMDQKSMKFFIVGTFFKKNLIMNHSYHDLMQKAMNFNHVAIVSVKGSD